jgi:hypothetical protein
VTATVRTWDHSFACGIHDDQPCTCKEDQPVNYPDIRPQAVQDAEAHAWLADDEYPDAAPFGVTDERARAEGFVDAEEVCEAVAR